MVFSIYAKLLVLRDFKFVSSLAQNMSNKARADNAGALIFLHGLGDTPNGWSHLKSQLPSIRPNLKNMTYSFPAAPIISISINSDMRMPGWFDIYSWPIAIGDTDDKPGILAAVREVEKHVVALRQSGIPTNRIVIGGFSQGGAIALQAAYNDAVKANKDTQYAACVCLSGWLTRVEDFSNPGLSDSSKRIPLFWAHGNFDDKVVFGFDNFLPAPFPSNWTILLSYKRSCSIHLGSFRSAEIWCQ